MHYNASRKGIACIVLAGAARMTGNRKTPLPQTMA